MVIGHNRVKAFAELVIKGQAKIEDQYTFHNLSITTENKRIK